MKYFVHYSAYISSFNKTLLDLMIYQLRIFAIEEQYKVWSMEVS